MADSTLAAMSAVAALDGTELSYWDQNGDRKGTPFDIATFLAKLRPLANSNIATVGAGTLTAAAIVGGLITRSGSVAAYTDTVDTAALIIAALGSGAGVTMSWPLLVKNTVPFAQTIAASSGVTLSGQTIVPPNSVGLFLVTYSGSGTVTIRGVGIMPLTTRPLESNTAISTVGAGTLTAAGLAGGVVTRSGSVAAYSDATDTAANIIAALPNGNVGQSWEVTIKNTVAFAQTITAGSGVTLSGQTVIPPNSVGRFLLTYSAAGAVTMQGLSVAPISTAMPEVATALNTVGAGTVTAAGIVGGVTTRGGAQSGTAFIDTTDTAANIIAAAPNASAGQSWEWTYQNNTNALATIAAGASVTLSGILAVPANSWIRFLVTVATGSTVTMKAIAAGATAALPPSKFTTAAKTAGTFAAGDITGAEFSVLQNTGAVPGNQTVRTAAQMLADIPGAQAGFSCRFRIVNTGAGTLTIVVDAGPTVTLTGTMTVAQNVFRDYLLTFDSATTATIQSIGSGVSP